MTIPRAFLLQPLYAGFLFHHRGTKELISTHFLNISSYFMFDDDGGEWYLGHTWWWYLGIIYATVIKEVTMCGAENQTQIDHV